MLQNIETEHKEVRGAITTYDIALGLAHTVRMADALALSQEVTAELIEKLRTKLTETDTRHYKVAKALGKVAGVLETPQVLLTGEVEAPVEPEPTLALKTLATILQDVKEPTRTRRRVAQPSRFSRDRNIAYDGSNPVTVVNMNEPWMGDALCSEVDGEMFFPLRGGSTREAKSICARCEVTEQCLHYALENDIKEGIWGGKSDRERRKLKRTNAS